MRFEFIVAVGVIDAWPSGRRGGRRELLGLTLLSRPLLFAPVDPDVALARGVPTRLVRLLFVYLLALTVTEAAQIVGRCWF